MIATFAHPDLTAKTFRDLTNSRKVFIKSDDLGDYTLAPSTPLPARIASDYPLAVRRAWLHFKQGNQTVTV